MLRIVPFILSIIVVIFLGGCENEQLSVLQDEKKQWDQKEEAYQKGIAEFTETNDMLRARLENHQTKSQPLPSLEQLLYEDNLEIYEKYPWLQTNQNEIILNKVTIGKYKDDPQAVTVTDPLILEYVPSLLQVKHRYFDGFPNGFQSPVGEYMYTLQTNTDEYDVQVIGRKLMAVGEDRLEVFGDIHLLGAAFVKSDDDYEIHIFTKIKNSGLMIGQKQHTYALFNEFRIKGVASVLTESSLLKQQPTEEPGELLETLTFYYQGQKINMNLYLDYIHLIEDDTYYWLQKDRIGLSIMSFLSAG